MMTTHMQAWRWSGEAFEPCDSIPVDDRGFRYGMALFESLRVWRSVPLFFDEHAARIRHACADREFRIDDRAVTAAGALLRGVGRDGFARLYITAGDGWVAAPAEHCRIFVLLENRERHLAEACDLAIPHEPHQPLFGGLKTANYWSRIDLLQRAMRADKDEALLFNEHAELVSACMANVFVVHGGSIRTPALACGARDGVVREWVLRQVGAKQCSLFVEDLQSADEVFLTNSWLGILPAASVEGRTLPSRAISEDLMRRFDVALEQYGS